MPGKALVGHLFYKDGACMPAIFLDVSGDPIMESGVLALYRTQRLSRIKVRFDEDGNVSLDAVKELLDGSRLVDLIVRFVPDDKDDIDAFMGLMELTHSWVLIIRLSKTEIHLVVSPDDDAVMLRYASRRVSEVRRFNANVGT